jgi:FtsP/CotA-like multicopper oxidase with cupredoxin domain
MKSLIMKIKQSLTKLVSVLLLVITSNASYAGIDGVTGNFDAEKNTRTFDLFADKALITTPDGDSILMWGYAYDGGSMQYPGPTLIVNQGDTVTVSLTNDLSIPVSIVFPGQDNVVASGGNPGVIASEAEAGGNVSYTFTASNAGTYMYHSGTNADLQIEMGLVGALIVRPSTPNQAYNHSDTAYDYEYLFLLTEMDPAIHHKVAAGLPVDNTEYHPTLWFINGRNGPDTMADANVAWLPNQPYNILPRVHPGDTALMRVISAGRDLHPFHTHGNHFKMLARDGRLLQSTAGAGVDLMVEDYTLQAVPGSTYDAVWNWTGEKLGWDIFGTNDEGFIHSCADGSGDGFDDVTNEYCADHDVKMPVTLPELSEMTFGGFYSGSPFLGAFGDLPPGEGGLNLNGGLFYMWHSHTEVELVNNDIYPGGMMTMMIVEPPGVDIQ